MTVENGLKKKDWSIKPKPFLPVEKILNLNQPRKVDPYTTWIK